MPDKSHKSLHTTLITTGQPSYEPSTAHSLYKARTKNSHKKHKMTSELQKVVMNGLKRGLSPELLCGRLELETGTKLHNETIYRFIYSTEYKYLNLWEYLDKAHKKRKNKHRRQGRKSNIIKRVSIHERAAEVNNRSEFGQWEGDSVLSSRKGTGGIQTQVERMSRYIFADKVSTTSADEGIRAALNIFKQLPPPARKSATFDNGVEFYKHYKLTECLNMNTYFADPYSAYQRGTNEHMNGKLRRFFPKGTNFASVTAQELQEVVTFYNTRPMKCLGFRTPEEVFDDEVEKLG
jgi:IS30 family transposase